MGDGPNLEEKVVGVEAVECGHSSTAEAGPKGDRCCIRYWCDLDVEPLLGDETEAVPVEDAWKSSAHRKREAGNANRR